MIFNLINAMKISNTIIIYTPPSTKEQKSTLGKVRGILKKHKINYRLANRDKLDKNKLKDTELVIAVGGDGTFLRAAHFIGRQVLLGVNADVKNKEGFFMKADKSNFAKKLKKIMNGTANVRKLPRLEAYINGKKIDSLALNEFFIGARKSYHAAKYVIKLGGRKERQKSSGILVATPTGSYAWAKSCCGKTLPLNSKKYQFVVREPYEGKVFKNYRLKYGVLGKAQKVDVVSEMLDGILVADSVGREHFLKSGSRVSVRLSGKHLSAVWE